MLKCLKYEVGGIICHKILMNDIWLSKQDYSRDDKQLLSSSQ